MTRALARSIFILAIALACGGARAEDKSAAAPLNPLAAMKPASFQAFVERPLFSASRRMPKAPDEKDSAPVAVAAPAVDLKLLGVTTSPDGSVALISASGEDAESHSLREGETLEGWTVKVITPATVTLTKNGETMDLSIFQTKSDDAEAGLDGSSDGPATIVFGPAD